MATAFCVRAARNCGGNCHHEKRHPECPMWSRMRTWKPNWMRITMRAITIFSTTSTTNDNRGTSDFVIIFPIFLDDFGYNFVDPSSVAVITIDLCVTAASSTMESTSHSIANRSCLIRTRSQVQRRSVRKIPSAATAHRLELHRQDSIT